MPTISCRRIIIAAVIFLAAVYMKYCLPTLAQAAAPAMGEVMDGEELAVPLPTEVVAWLGWS